MKHYLYCLLLALLIQLPLYGQHNAATYIQQFSTENGLPSNGIKGMRWDESTGFLWLATEAGVVRFNGVNFKNFTKENTPGMTAERMMFILSNTAKRIYTADANGNIFRIRENKLEAWGAQKNIRAKTFGYHKFLAVSDSCYLQAIKRPDADSSLLPIGKIIPLNDNSCIIWREKQLYYYSTGHSPKRCFPGPPEGIKNIFIVGHTCYFLRSDGILFQFDPVTGARKPVTVTDETGTPPAFTWHEGQLIWEPGLDNPIYIKGDHAWLLEQQNNNLVTTLISQSVPLDAYIQSVIYQKKNGTLFIATDSRGLIIIRKNLVRSKKRKDTLTKNRNAYYSQVLLDNNTILTNEGDIIGESNRPPSVIPIRGKFNFTVATTGDTSLWFVQRHPQQNVNCLHAYNYTTRTEKAYTRIVLSGQCIISTAGTSVYIIDEKGIGELKGDSLRYDYKFTPDPDRTIYYDARETEPGLLTIASCNGLLTYHINTHTLEEPAKDQNYCFRTLWMYKGYLFLGTYGAGFFIKKGERMRRMPLDKNNYLLYTHCFMPDQQGYCWLSTNRGLFKARLDELIAAFEQNSNRVYYHYFGKQDGMEMTELNGGCTPCALTMAGGILSFPTMDGLLWVDPQKANPELPAGKIFFDDIRVDNKVYEADSLPAHPLAPGTAEIVFSLAYAAWCNPENIYIDYQLNDSVNWKPVNFSNGAEIRLNSLAPGTYHLRIRKLNGFGVNNYSYKDISFTISAPWYKRWWFYLLVLLALGGLIALILHIRTTQYRVQQQKLEKQVAEKTMALQQQNETLEKNNSIKNRLISIISHDIITPLKFVTVAGQNLIAKRPLMSEELQQETIREMTNTSMELQLLSTNILNWIKYQQENRRLAKENILVHELVNQVFGILNSLARQKNLQLINQVDQQISIYQYREPLKIIIYNLATNAINFSEKGAIQVNAWLEEDELKLTVKDEGVGMTPEQIKNILADEFIVSSANIDNRKGNGLGYLIIKDLVKTMGASLQIESEKNAGTMVIITFPAT